MRDIDQHALDLHPFLQEQADAQGLAIGFSERGLQVGVEAGERGFGFFDVAGREEKVEGLGLRACEEEFVDETAADSEA